MNGIKWGSLRDLLGIFSKELNFLLVQTLESYQDQRDINGSCQSIIYKWYKFIKELIDLFIISFFARFINIFYWTNINIMIYNIT